MSSFTVSMILSLVDRATGPLRAVTQKMGAAAGAAGRLASPENIARLEAQRGALARQALAAGGMAFALQRALRPAIAFESAMADVAKVVDFQGEGAMAALADDILRLSTRIPIAAEGLAAIAAAAGQANLIDAALPDDARRAQLTAFAEAAAKMGVAFEIGAAEAGEAMATLRNVFQLTQPQVERLADATNHLSNSMASTARDITNVITRTGGVSRLFGLAEEQAAALASSFLAVGLGPERAGTAINALLSRLVTAPKQADKFQEALAELGLEAETLKRAIGEDADGALLAFLETVRGSDDALGILTDLFGRENADEIALLVQSLDQARRAFGLIGDETLFAGSMQREFTSRSATTENALLLLGNQLRRVQVALGSALLPSIVALAQALAPLLEQFNAWAQANPELIKALTALTAGLLAFKIAAIAARLLFGELALGAMRLFRALRWVGLVALPLVRTAVMALSAAMLRNPIGLALTAIALAAGLIIEHWTPIKQFFIDLWNDVVAAFDAAWARIKPIADAIAAAISATDFTFGGGAQDGTQGGGSDAPNGTLLDPEFGGFRARGGPVRAGRGYIVGEDGPEWFAPGVSGNIVAHADLLSLARIPVDTRPAGGGAARAAGGGGGAVSVGAIHVHAAPGMDARAVADEVMRRIREAGRGARDLHDGPHYGGPHYGSAR